VGKAAQQKRVHARPQRALRGVPTINRSARFVVDGGHGAEAGAFAHPTKNVNT
jgi:hypothetical protein